MKEYGEILLGVVLAIAGIGMLVIPQVDWFREALKIVILGIIPLIVLLVGAVFLMIGISDVREKGEEEITESAGTEGEREKGEGD
ncbi:hypothetical protein DRN97_09175 [Methanosarcinales archaeon]|nr:MAG: hypothetical protein DRN97_09175 [Methanosarcinales archaeon]